MIFVLNEWIFHDLWGENGTDKQRESLEFLSVFQSSDDKFVIPAEPRWTRKAYHLMRMPDVRIRGISRLLQSLLRNPDRAIQQETTPEIPESLLNQLPEEDVYLASAYLSVGADMLVTTDEGLFKSVSGSEIISCRMRDEFLAGYLAS